MRLRRAATAVLAVVTGALAAQEDASDAAPQPRDVAPGVRIDWKQKVVELDAKVVLRDGPLELLACSPRSREHESILVVPARPQDIYHALGLIGLEPGKPPRYDDATQRSIPATGQRLELAVRVTRDGESRTTPVERWLLATDGRQIEGRLNWVFAGSHKAPDGRFTADLDGTIACVVDFDSALIALGTSHSADNEALWLRANPKEIPPLGTSCTLMIRAAIEPEAPPPAKP